MLEKFMQLKQFTRSSNKGFTLLELLVTLVVASIITGLALKLIVDQRQLFLNDQIRTQVNQNLRASLDLVGADIKQAGERLTNTTLPVVKILNGASGASDELVLQRLVIDQILPVCQTVTTGTSTSTIEVAQKNGVGLCKASFSSPTATLPTNLIRWKDSRCAKDDGTSACTRTADVNRTTPSNRCAEEKNGTDKECLWAYIYDPTNNRGEFFLYGFESPKNTPDTSTNTYRVHRVDGGTWKYTYDVTTTSPVLYILEERRYRLKNNVLELILNQLDPDTNSAAPNFLVDNQTSPIRLVNQLSNFQVQALMQDSITASPTRDNFNNPASPPPVTTPPTVDDWKTIKAIKVDLTAINPASSSTKVPNLSASARFFPRNISSK